ncbi:MAG: phosphoribosyltransferase [Actinomycetota bacterium]
MIFTDRTDAGRQLADALAEEPAIRDADRVCVLAVPRGGLPVGVEVARALGVPLDVSVARTLRSPHDPDIAFGAVAADGYVHIDEAEVERLGLSQEEIDAEVEDRRRRISRRMGIFREVLDPVDLEGAIVIVVDDGIATGATAMMACGMARRAGAAEVVVAVPVAPEDAEDRLTEWADRVLVLTTPAEFLAVSQAYQDYTQLSDEEILDLLGSAAAVGS